MPYIITTSEPFNAAVHVHVPAFIRRAVATLDEADLYLQRVDGWHAFDARELPETGGTIGPLPDGTVIEVAQVAWVDLYDGPIRTKRQILDAYNAQEVAR